VADGRSEVAVPLCSERGSDAHLTTLGYNFAISIMPFRAGRPIGEVQVDVHREFRSGDQDKSR
jgi:hypothetical protein